MPTMEDSSETEMKWVAGRRAVTSWHATRDAQLSLHCGATFNGRFTALVRSSRLLTGTSSPAVRNDWRTRNDNENKSIYYLNGFNRIKQLKKGFKV